MSIPSGNRAGKKQLEVWPTSPFLFRQNAHRKGNRYIVKKEKRTTILRFYSFTKGLRHNFVLALLTMAISVFAGYMTPQIIRVTVDSVINDSPFNLPSFLATQIENMGGRDFLRQNLILCALASLLFAVLAGISTYLSRMNMAKGCEGTVTKIRNTLFSHIQRLPYAWHNKNQTGDIIQRCTQDVDLIHNFINDQMMELVRVVFLIVVSLALMFSMNAKLALIAFIFIPIVVGYSMIFFVIVGDRFRIADEAEGKLTAMVQENLTGVRVVRAFGRERFEKDKFNKQNDLFSDLWVRLGHVMGVNWGIGDLLSGIQVLTIIAAGIVFVVDGAITEGEYLAFVAYNSMLVWPTRSLGRLLSELSKTGISSKRIFEILDAEPEKDAETPVTPPMDRDIVFKHVNFSYGASGEVLHDIDLKIPAGTTLGILGSTGSGKSTLTYLLDRLYELPEGSRDSKGQHVANLLQFGPDETIQTVLSIPNYDVAKYLVLATRSGKVKKTALAEYDSPRQGGLIAVRLMTDENGENADELIGAALCNADDDIILVSKQGMSLKFEANDEQLRPMGRQTAGVQGMKFRDGDELLAMDVVQGDSDRDLLVVTNEGFAKRTAISEYRLQGRNGYGVKAVQLAEGRGSLVGAVIVEESDQIMAIMKSGKVIRSNVAEVKRTGRTTQGVTLAKPDKNDEIISIARNEETDEDDAEQAAAENGAAQNDAAAQSQAETTTENSAETGTEATSDAGDGENVEA